MYKNKNKPKVVTVLGAGNFGTAISQVLAENGHRVNLWNWEQDHLPLKQIEKYHENKKYMPGIKLLKNIVPMYRLDMALHATNAVFFAVPSMSMEHVVSFASRSIESKSIFVYFSKGLHPELHKPMSSIIGKHVRPALKKKIVTISGPAVAEQLIHHHVSMMNIAGKNRGSVNQVKNILENDFVKLVPVKDMIGIEVAGSFKNVYAVLMGVCDGMKHGLNTKAGLLAFAMSEIGDVVHALGGKRKTAHELAGLGDLVGTAFSQYSRNRQFGEYIGKGLSRKKALSKMKQTVEGINATHCLHSIAKKNGIKLPLASLVYSIVFGRGDARKKMQNFLKKL